MVSANIVRQLNERQVGHLSHLRRDLGAANAAPDERTVHKDLAGVRNLTPETEPKPVTGLDGKTYTPMAWPA